MYVLGIRHMERLDALVRFLELLLVSPARVVLAPPDTEPAVGLSVL